MIVQQRSTGRRLHSYLSFGLLVVLTTLSALFLQLRPGPQAYAAGQLEVVYANYNTVPTTSPQAQPTFEIINNTSASVALSSLTIRYWFTVDTNQPLVFNCYYAVVNCANVTGTFTAFTPAISSADTFLQVGFTAGAGSIPAGGNSGQIQVAFHKADWSAFNQTNDYSWNAHIVSLSPPQVNQQVGLYQNNQLVAGVPPSQPLQGTPITANVTGTSLGQLPANAIGVNAPVFDGDLTDADIPSLLSNAGIKLLRFPGGGTADTYHWENNTVDLGPNVPSNLQSFAAPNDTFDAFMGQTLAAGAQATITVDYGDGTPAEAAAWVQYANEGGPNYNGVVPTYAPVTINGVTYKPNPNGNTYGIKYWEIGNEVYGDGTYSGAFEFTGKPIGPATYAQGVVDYSQAMKAVDPSIQIGAVLAMPGNFPDGITNANSPQDWNTTVLTKACSSIDFVDVHWYPQNPGNETDAGLLASPEQSTATSTDAGIAAMVSNLRKEISNDCGAHASSVAIRVTETNSTSFNIGKQTTSLVNALFQDDDLTTWLENGATNVDWWALHNGIVTGNNNAATLFGTNQYGDYGILSNGTSSAGLSEPPVDTPFPAYFGFQMVSDLLGPTATGSMLSSNSPNSLVAIHAVLQANGSLAIMLINKDPGNTYGVTVNLPSTFVASGAPATVFSYGQPNVNTGVTSTSVGVASGATSVALSIAPYSSTTIVIP